MPPTFLLCGVDVAPTLAVHELLRALNDVHQAKEKRAPADVYIEPPVAGYGILEFQSYAAIIEAGCRAGRAALAEWQSPGALVPARPLDALRRALADLEAALAPDVGSL